MKMSMFMFILSFFLMAVPVAAADLKVTWNDNSTNEDGFNLERKVGTEAFAPLVTLPPDSTEHDDVNVIVGVNHCYRLNAFNAAGATAWTPEVCKIPVDIPVMPDGVVIIQNAVVTIIINP